MYTPRIAFAVAAVAVALLNPLPAWSAAAPCAGGNAGGYPCLGIDLQAFVPISGLGGLYLNDIWGWTDPTTGREYALVGLDNGTAFVDVTNPVSPVRLGNLATATNTSTWRDIKVYKDHAFIVSEAAGHGMQVFDLRRLRSVATPPAVFTADANYTTVGSAHNIAIDEATGLAVIVGANACNGGLHLVDIRDPVNPVFAGCFAADGYTHDTQCVIYHGPDSAHTGSEVCFAFNEDTVTIVDVTNRAAPTQLSRTGYPQVGYTHQGWATEDHAYMLVDDELDERDFTVNTRTHLWDIRDLDNPIYMGFFSHPVAAIDHNIYIVGNLAFASNYRSGLRVLDISCIASGIVTQLGYLDTYVASDSARFDGSWSNYPFFASGNVVVSSIDEGLFVVRPQLVPRTPPVPIAPATPTICEGQFASLSIPGAWNTITWSTEPPGQPGDGATGTPIDVDPRLNTTYRVHADDGTGCGSSAATVVTVEPDVAAPALGNVLLLTRAITTPELTFYWRDLTGLWGDYQIIGLPAANGPASAANFSGPGSSQIASAVPGVQQIVSPNGQDVPAGSVYYRVRATSPCAGAPGPFE